MERKPEGMAETKEGPESQSELLLELMMFTTADCVNVAAYLAMSLGHVTDIYVAQDLFHFMHNYFYISNVSPVGMLLNGIILVTGARKVTQLDNREVNYWMR